MSSTISKTTAPSRAALASVGDRLDLDTNADDVDPDAVRALAIAETRFRTLRDRAAGGPTRTKTIQDDYEAEFYKRFRRIKGLVRETVVENDAFELRESSSIGRPTPPSTLSVQSSDPDWWRKYVAERRSGAIEINAEPESTFPFEKRAEKIDAFLDWLRDVQDDELLDVRRRDRDGRVAVRDEWQNVYVRRAYAKGVKFGNQRLREQGVDVSAIDLDDVFNTPVHADALGVLYTRNYRELQGITEAMDQQISRELAEGFAKGENPRKIARRINDRVDKIGLTRSRTLARTEVINAHSESTLNRYQQILGDDAEVTGRAEWLTAGDNRVCPICEGLEGSTYTIDDARGLIPIHPNCRCTWIPVVRSGSESGSSGSVAA